MLLFNTGLGETRLVPVSESFVFILVRNIEQTITRVVQKIRKKEYGYVRDELTKKYIYI